MSRARDLDLYLTEIQARPFDWSAWNCCHFTAMWVRLVTGRNVMAGLPAMSTRLTAQRLIGQLGGSLRAVWTRWLEREPILPTLAQVGDVVLVQVDDVEAVGICCGRTAAVLTEANGVAHVPMSSALAAWWVGA